MARVRLQRFIPATKPEKDLYSDTAREHKPQIGIFQKGGSHKIMATDDLVTRYEKLRCSDISDALDCLGYYDTYVMSPKMRPIWEGARFVGRAYTVRLVPTNKSYPRLSPEEYFQELKRLSAYRFAREETIPDGSVLVIAAGRKMAGLLGSANTLRFTHRGVRGFVIDGCCRDSDEIILQRVPVFCTVRSMTHVIGRLEESTVNEIIECAGVRVAPYDVVVGDSDGVVVVPQELAEEVAQIAEEIRRDDMRVRADLYKALGRPLDATVDVEQFF